MDSTYWPMTGLRLRTPDLELRWPSLYDLEELARLAEAGIHDPAVQPFSVPWTDLPPAERGRSVLQYQWQCWGSWTPARWALELAVVRGGSIAGVQGISARDFGVRREVSTGSWLGQAYQGQGIGTQMRAAVLELAFNGLRAEHAVSSAFSDNAASLAVSHKLGYWEDGIDVLSMRGKPAAMQRLRMDRAAWQAARSVPVEIIGLEPCLPHFGLALEPAADTAKAGQVVG
jgi:RimJ/RimL family protein N-acetyltransferase